VRIHITPVESFAALGLQWRALEAALPRPGFFQSWSWVGCLAEERYADAVLLRAEDGGETLGLALFNQRRGRLCLAEAGEAGLDAPFIEHNAPLCADAGVAAALLRAAWDVRGARRLVLSGVAPALLEAAGGIAWRRQERPAPYVDLDALRASGADYLATRSANTRQQVRRSDRRYGELTLSAAADVMEALHFFDAMLPLHARTWHARGVPGAFDSDFMRRFHRTLITSAMPRGEVEMLRLQAASGDVGYLYNFRLNGRVHAYQSGLDHAGAGPHGKPGLSLHARAISRALAAGDSVYDFMAGADRYKRSLASDTVPLLWAELVRPWSLLGLAARLRRRL
jgi:CelD/BcsL family acetyltransferase involved in cellulose biosynthesis